MGPRDIDRNTLLIDAVINNDAGEVQKLLAVGAEVNHASIDHGTPLFIAARNGLSAMVVLLLEQPGINNSPLFRTNQSQLNQFTVNNTPEIRARMTEFITLQKDPNNIIMTPIEIAQVMGHKDIAELIQSKTVDILRMLPADVGNMLLTFLGPKDLSASITSKYYRDIFRLFATRPTELRVHWLGVFKRHFPHLLTPEMNEMNHQQYIEAFRNAEEDEYKDFTTKQRKLFYLVKEGQAEDICRLHIEFKDLCVLDSQGNSALAWAGATQNKKILNHFYLIATEFYHSDNNEINVKKVDDHQFTLLHWAACCAQPPDIVEELIKHGYEIEAKTDCDETPIYLAISYGNTSIFDILLANGAEVNNGQMLLHCAAANGRADIVDTLLAKGADVNIGADGNVTPLFLAAQNGEDNIVALLLSQPGIIVTNPITSNQQLLTEYVAARSLEIQQRMKEFIDGQPNPDEIHMQPIDMARVMGHEHIVALLQDKLQVNNKFNL